MKQNLNGSKSGTSLRNRVCRWKSWGDKMNQKSLIVDQNFKQNFYDFVAKYTRALFDPPLMCSCDGSNGSKRQL